MTNWTEEALEAHGYETRAAAVRKATTAETARDDYLLGRFARYLAEPPAPNDGQNPTELERLRGRTREGGPAGRTRKEGER